VGLHVVIKQQFWYLKLGPTQQLVMFCIVIVVRV